MLIYSTPGITIVFLRLQLDLEGRKLGAATLASITVCMYVYMYIYLYVKCNEDASRVGEIETYLRLANENSQGYERMESME